MVKMSGLAKLCLVIGGFLSACLIASGAVYAYQSFTQSAAAQASAGMYAFGDLILFVEIFGILALLPTGLALYFVVRKFSLRGR